MKNSIVFVLRKEKDGRLLAVFNRYNRQSDLIMCCSLEEGFGIVSREYIYNRTRPASSEEGAELRAYLDEFRCVRRLSKVRDF